MLIVCLLTDNWVISSLLWIKVLCTFIDKTLCRLTFSLLLSKYLRVELLGGISMYEFYKKLVSTFLKWSCNFRFPPTTDKSNSCSTFTPTLSIVSAFDCSDCSEYIAVFYYGWNLHFPNEYWYWALFSCAFWLFVHFLGWNVRSYILLIIFWITCLTDLHVSYRYIRSYKSVIYSMYTHEYTLIFSEEMSSLAAIRFTNIFIEYVACHLTFLIWFSFKE